MLWLIFDNFQLKFVKTWELWTTQISHSCTSRTIKTLLGKPRQRTCFSGHQQKGRPIRANFFIGICLVLYWFLVQRQQCVYYLWQPISVCKSVNMVRFFCFYGTPSMSSLVQPKWRSTQNSGCLHVLLCFSFPHVQLKIRLFCLSSSW